MPTDRVMSEDLQKRANVYLRKSKQDFHHLLISKAERDMEPPQVKTSRYDAFVDYAKGKVEKAKAKVEKAKTKVSSKEEDGESSSDDDGEEDLVKENKSSAKKCAKKIYKFLRISWGFVMLVVAQYANLDLAGDFYGDAFPDLDLANFSDGWRPEDHNLTIADECRVKRKILATCKIFLKSFFNLEFQDR